MNRDVLSALLLAAALILFVSPLAAGEFKSGETLTQNDPVAGDLYVGAGTASIAGPVAGDLNVAGGSATISNSVGEDLQIVAGTANIRGAVADDLRVMGGTVVQSGTVGGDALLGGFDLTVTGRVAGDLVAAGGMIHLNAPVGGRAKIGGGEISIAGPVTGDIEVRAETVRIDGKIGGKATISAREIEIGPNAAFAGKVVYWSENTPDFGNASAERDESLRMEEEEFHAESMAPGYFAAGFAGFLLSLFSGALSIGALLLLFRGFVLRSAGVIGERWSAVAGQGAIYLLISPMGILLFLITVVGIPLGLLWLSVFGFSIIFAKAIAAGALAAFLLQRTGRDPSPWLLFGTALAVFILLKLIGLIPLLGFLFGIFWVILASGLVINEIAELRKST